MTEPELIHIDQGADRTITVSAITDGDGNPLDVTGWTVHAMARRDTVDGAVVAEWHTAPTGDQGLAVASGAQVVLHITNAMSTAWDWAYALLQAEMTEPPPGNRVERIIPTTRLRLDREIVRP